MAGNTCSRGESGPKSWDEFEQSALKANPAGCAVSGGNRDSFLDDLIEKYGPPIYPDTQGRLTVLNQFFFAAYTIRKCGLVKDYIFWRQYQPETGLWKMITDAELTNLISREMLEFSKKYNVPQLAAKRTYDTCSDIKKVADGEQAEMSKFRQNRGNFIHTRNGMVVIEQDGTHRQLQAVFSGILQHEPDGN